jgi:hypothetical protein
LGLMAIAAGRRRPSIASRRAQCPETAEEPRWGAEGPPSACPSQTVFPLYWIQPS